MIARRFSPVRRTDGQTKVRCRLCGRWYEAVTYSHLLYIHRIRKPQAYKDRFGLLKLTSVRVRRKIAKEKTLVCDSDLRYLREHWGRISLREMASRIGRDPATIRGQARRLGLPPLVESWDPSKVERMIRAMHRGGLPLNSGRVRTDEPGLYKAGRYHFRSWRNAVSAAGINYSDVALRGPFQRWSTHRIVREIKTLLSGPGRLPGPRATAFEALRGRAKLLWELAAGDAGRRKELRNGRPLKCPAYPPRGVAGIALLGCVSTNAVTRGSVKKPGDTVPPEDGSGRLTRLFDVS